MEYLSANIKANTTFLEDPPDITVQMMSSSIWMAMMKNKQDS